MGKRAAALCACVTLIGCDGSPMVRVRENVPQSGPDAPDDTNSETGIESPYSGAEGTLSASNPDAGGHDAASLDGRSPDLDGRGRDADANGGWDGAVPIPGTLRINEVDCRTDRVELINTGSAPEDLTRYALSDDLTKSTHRSVLAGSLDAGDYRVVTLTDFGLKCGVDPAFLLQGDTLADVAEAAALPAGASFGRLPDGTGNFASNIPTFGGPNRAWSDPSAALFDPFATPVAVALVIDDANKAALDADPRSYVHALATLQAGDQRIGPIDIGVRLKGSLGSFRSLAAKAALKVDADRFVAGQSFFGLSKLTFNNFAQDPSTIHEWLGYQLFAAVGVPVPRVGFAQVTVNGQPYGPYLLVEDTTSNAYLQNQFGATTGLYEPSLGSDLTPEQVPTFDVKQGDPADFSALLAIASPLADGARTSWFDTVGAHVAWPEVLRVQAADITHGNGDGYAYARNNYMLHLDGAGTLRMLPWGIDASFIAQLDYFRTESLLLARCFEEPRCVALWIDALDDVYAKESALLTPAFLARARQLGQLNTLRFADDTRWDHDAATIALEVENTLTRLLSNLQHLHDRIDCQRVSGSDFDGDGARCELDCDDNDATRYRGAPEVCGDRIDQSCNGVADDGDACPACVAHPALDGLFVCPRAMPIAGLRAACQALSAAPLTIESAGENASLSAALAGWFHERSYFLGMSDEARPNAFVWNSGSTASYRHFVGGYPFARNVGQGPRCATMSEDGEWRTEQCDTRVPGACER